MTLRALVASRHEVAAVVSRPDRPRGRHGAPQPPPVKQVAVASGIPVVQPASPKDDGFAATLAGFRPDACAVVAYGHLLPETVLRVPPKGTVNAHFSLLPRYRGAAPVQRAIMAGDAETGVCVFLLEPTLDTGPILHRVVVPIAADDTTGTLLEKLAPIGAAAIVRTLDALEDGTATPAAQDPAAATPAPKIRPEETRIDWTRPAAEIRDLIRALNPNPGAWTTFRGKRVKVWKAEIVPGRGSPGAVLRPGEEFVVAAGTDSLRLVEIQPEGKRPMTPDAFARGARLSDADSFGIPAGGR